MPSRKMTIKVSEVEYGLIQQARAELRKKGLDDAGISDEEVNEYDWGSLALGAIVGIGAYLLWKNLTEKKE